MPLPCFPWNIQDLEMPTAFKPELSYYEQLCNFYLYFQNEMIPAFNKLESNILNFKNDITNKYNELMAVWAATQKWISEWFSKIDVSEEFYQMWLRVVQSGEALQVMKPYIDEQLDIHWNNFLTDYNTYKNNLTNEWNVYQNNLNNSNKEFQDNLVSANNEFKTNMETSFNSFKTNINNTINGFNTKLTGFENQLNTFNTKINGFENRLDDDEQAISANTTAIGNINTSISTINGKISGIQNDITNLTDLVGDLNTQIANVVKTHFYSSVTEMINEKNYKAGDYAVVIPELYNPSLWFISATPHGNGQVFYGTTSPQGDLPINYYATISGKTLYLSSLIEDNINITQYASYYNIIIIDVDKTINLSPNNSSTLTKVDSINVNSNIVNVNDKNNYINKCNFENINNLIYEGNCTNNKFINCTIGFNSATDITTFENCYFNYCLINVLSDKIKFNNCQFDNCNFVIDYINIGNCKFNNCHLQNNNSVPIILFNNNIFYNSTFDFNIFRNNVIPTNNYFNNCIFTDTLQTFSLGQNTQRYTPCNYFHNCVLNGLWIDYIKTNSYSTNTKIIYTKASAEKTFANCVGDLLLVFNVKSESLVFYNCNLTCKYLIYNNFEDFDISAQNSNLYLYFSLSGTTSTLTLTERSANSNVDIFQNVGNFVNNAPSSVNLRKA